MRFLIWIYLIFSITMIHGQSKSDLNSKNCLNDTLIIELKATYYPSPIYRKVLFRFNGTNWSITKSGHIDKSNITEASGSKIDYCDIYTRLLKNNVFTLPSQQEIPNTESLVDDGFSYELSFRIGNLTGDYSFDNPDNYVKYYPNNNTFRKYKNIADIFLKELFYQ